MYLIKKLSVICLFTFIFPTALASTEPAAKVQVVFEKITTELKRFDSQGQLQRDNTLIVLEQFLKPEIEEKYFAYKVLALQLKKLSAEQKTQMIELLLKMLMNNYAGLLEKYDNERIVIGETEFGNKLKTAEVSFVIKRVQQDIKAKVKLIKDPNEQWKFYDIEVEGISLVTSKQAEINASFSSLGIEGTIAKLKSKV